MGARTLSIIFQVVFRSPRGSARRALAGRRCARCCAGTTAARRDACPPPFLLAVPARARQARAREFSAEDPSPCRRSSTWAHARTPRRARIIPAARLFGGCAPSCPPASEKEARAPRARRRVQARRCARGARRLAPPFCHRACLLLIPRGARCRAQVPSRARRAANRPAHPAGPAGARCARQMLSCRPRPKRTRPRTGAACWWGCWAPAGAARGRTAPCLAWARGRPGLRPSRSLLALRGRRSIVLVFLASRHAWTCSSLLCCTR